MKRNILAIFGLLALAILVGLLGGCAGTDYASYKNVAGYDVIQGGRTGAFGTDNSWVLAQPAPQAQQIYAPAPVTQAPYCAQGAQVQGCQQQYVAPTYAPPAPVAQQAPVYCAPGTPATRQGCQQVVTSAPQQEIILLEKTYTRSATSWEGCPDKTPNRRARNIRREEASERWTEEVLAPVPVAPVYYAPAPTPAPAPQSFIVVPQAAPVFGFGSGPSTGNSLLPALAIAGGMVGGAALLPANQTNVSQTGGGANVRMRQGQIQDQQQSEQQTAIGGAATAINTNSNDVGVDIRGRR